MSLKRSGGSVPGFGSGDPNNWMSAMFRRPSDETPHVDDLEFVGTLGGTAQTPTGTATWVQAKSLLACGYEDQATSDFAARLWSLTPSYPVTIEAAVRAFGGSDVFQYVGIGFTDGTADTSAVMLIDVGADSNNINMRYGTLTSATTTPSTDTLGSTPVYGWVYLRLIWSAANTFKAQVSMDGVGWTQLALATTNPAVTIITPTHFGAVVSSWGASTVHLASWEYIRITEADLSA